MAFNFPDTPTLGQVYQGFTWDAEKWTSTAVTGSVRYDAAQTLTSTQKAQARANIDSLKKNYIVNGGMQVSQENGATAGTGSGYHPVDQFFSSYSQGGAISILQVASPTPGGSPNRIRITVTTADATVAATDFLSLIQLIEGLRLADLRFGSASAKTFTLQFGVKAPAGTYGVSFVNAAVSRGYVAEYVIAAGEANTDVVKSITLTGDIAGVWAADNTIGTYVRWGLMAGTNYQQATGAWTATTTPGIGSSSQFNFMGTVGNIFELFDVSLTEGSVAPAFQVPDYARELTVCQRYWQRLDTLAAGGYNIAGGAFYMPISWLTTMRASPTGNSLSVNYANVPGITFWGLSASAAVISATLSVAGGGSFTIGSLQANARM